MSGRVGSGRVGSGRVGSGRVGSGRVGSGRVGSGRVGSGRVGSGRVGSGRVGSGRVGSGRVGSGRVGSGRVGSGRVGSGRVEVEVEKRSGWSCWSGRHRKEGGKVDLRSSRSRDVCRQVFLKWSGRVLSGSSMVHYRSDRGPLPSCRPRPNTRSRLI